MLTFEEANQRKAEKLADALRDINLDADANGGGFLLKKDLLKVIRRLGDKARTAIAEWET